MGLRDDLDRFREVGEENRMDLEEFIEHGQMGEDIKIPIKIVDLPEFVYDPTDQGGIGQAGEGQDPEQGDPVEFPDEEGDGDEAGEEPGEHGHYEMDPEEFAEELDDELDLDLDPKGKKVVEETLGDMVEVSQAGPKSALDVDYLYKQGLKRKLATWYDEEFLVEACLVEGVDARDVFDYVRSQHAMPVDWNTVESVYDVVRDEREPVYASTEALIEEYGGPKRAPPEHEIDNIPIRRDDERYRHPEVIQEKQKNVVVVNIRDVSGSMRDEKRELVERVFTPMDWYLQGKYEHAEFRYVAHDAEAWEVDRVDFFGIESGGGTRVSTAYELAKEILDEHYPFSEWNRYVFAAGDGENLQSDTKDNVVPLIEDIDANLHAYVEVKPGRSSVIDPIDQELGTDDGVVTEVVNGTDDVVPAIETILQAASSESNEADET